MARGSMDKKEIRFEVRGIAVPQGSAKAFPFKKKDGGLGVAVNTVNPALRAWREAIATEARAAVKKEIDYVYQGISNKPEFKLLDSALEIDCTFRLMQPKARKKESWVRTRPDLDKLVRAVLDACTGVIWKDDSQISHISACKLYGNPGVSVLIWEL